MSADQVTITQGQTRALVFSPRSNRHVCDGCGAPLFFTRDNRPELRGLYVGSLDDPSGFQPKFHVCAESAMAWLDIRDDLPRYAEKPEGMTRPLAYDPISGSSKLQD